MQKNITSPCDFPPHRSLTEGELLDAQRRDDGTWEGMDELTGSCDLPDHVAMSGEEVMAAQGEMDSPAVAVRPAPGRTRRSRSGESRGRPRAAGRVDPIAGGGGKKAGSSRKEGRPVGATDSRRAVRRRGIRLGRYMPAPEIAEGVPPKGAGRRRR
jgi:hypothetical protein